LFLLIFKGELILAGIENIFDEALESVKNIMIEKPDVSFRMAAYIIALKRMNEFIKSAGFLFQK
jgi:glutamate dehydrogenase/leucine dehydrogenase